jgi:hypothetical protein
MTVAVTGQCVDRTGSMSGVSKRSLHTLEFRVARVEDSDIRGALPCGVLANDSLVAHAVRRRTLEDPH